MDEELKGLVTASNEKLEKLNELVEKKADSEVLVKAQDEIKKEIVEYAKKHDELKEYAEKQQEQLDDISEKINTLSTIESKEDGIDISFKNMFESDSYKNIKEQKSIKGTFDIKASTITTANSFTETTTPIIQYQRDPVMGIDPRQALPIQNLVSKGITTSNYIDWVERTSETTGTAMKGEGSAYGQSDIGWTSYAQKVEKITDYIKVTREKLDDTDFIRSEIMAVLGYNLPYKLEDQLLNGNNTSPNLSGIISGAANQVAKTFSAPTGTEDTIPFANMYDCVKVAILQVELGNSATNTKSQGFAVTGIALNPVDYFLLSSEKDERGQYLFGSDGVMRVMGVPVFKTLKLTQGTYLIAAFNKCKLWTRQGITIELWDQEASDAITGLVTITAIARYCIQLKLADAFGFVTGTFTATKAAILQSD